MKLNKAKLLPWLAAGMFLLSACGQGSVSVFETPDAGTTAQTAPDTGKAQDDSSLQVHFIDVGQGDSILAQSDGHFLLIDAGENDQADRVVSYLKEQGVSSLDYVIGTHPHSDHIGGLDGVLEAFPVKTLILPPVEHTTKTFEDVLDAAADQGLSLTRPVPGDTYQLGDASFTIIAPNQDYGDDLNNWSVGIRLVCQDNSFVMCGDAEAAAEADICASFSDLSADVLKAGHHGSSTSSSDEFLDRVDPDWMVISCGAGNSYGHPHQETLDKAAAREIQVLRTDQLGTITAVCDGTNIVWETEQTDPPETSAQASYILNTSSKKFHRPDCSSASQIKEQNREEWTGDRKELIQQGYSPCGQCNP